MCVCVWIGQASNGVYSKSTMTAIRYGIGEHGRQRKRERRLGKKDKLKVCIAYIRERKRAKKKKRERIEHICLIVLFECFVFFFPAWPNQGGGRRFYRTINGRRRGRGRRRETTHIIIFIILILLIVVLFIINSDFCVFIFITQHIEDFSLCSQLLVSRLRPSEWTHKCESQRTSQESTNCVSIYVARSPFQTRAKNA